MFLRRLLSQILDLGYLLGCAKSMYGNPSFLLIARLDHVRLVPKPAAHIGQYHRGTHRVYLNIVWAPFHRHGASQLVQARLGYRVGRKTRCANKGRQRTSYGCTNTARCACYQGPTTRQGF